MSQGCDFLQGVSSQTSFVPEQFTGDEALMIQTAEEFSRKDVLPVSGRLDEHESGLMQALISKAGQLGFCGVDTPEQYGGLGLSKNLAARLLEHLSLNASFSVTIGITSGIGQLGLILFGTEAQKQQYLPQLASGEKIAAYALSEPNSGSDALSMTTRADRKGDQYILNGTKMWISNAQWADTFLAMAKVDGEKVTAFLIDRNFPGVSISREEHKMGLKGSSTARLVLEDAVIPADCVLHEVGLGHQVAFNALNLGRFKLSSMSLGPARDAIGLAAQYASERKQFGSAISEFGLIQQKFARMASLFFAAESMIYRTGHRIDGAFSQSGGTLSGNMKAAEEFSVECSMVKVFSTEVESQIIDDALQCFGGYGFTEEFPIARHYRDARVSRIYEGTNEINRLFIVDRIRKKINSHQAEPPHSGDSFVSELAAKAWGKVGQEQVEKGAMADLLILLYAVQSCRARAEKAGSQAKLLASAFENEANLKAAEAYQLISGESVQIPAPTAIDCETIAQLVYEGNRPWLGAPYPPSN